MNYENQKSFHSNVRENHLKCFDFSFLGTCKISDNQRSSNLFLSISGHAPQDQTPKGDHNVFLFRDLSLNQKRKR